MWSLHHAAYKPRFQPSVAASNLRGALPGWFQTYFEHVLSGRGYQFWSGIGSDIGELTLLAAFVIWLRQHNCHVRRCWRMAWHPHPTTVTQSAATITPNTAA